jgi:hypothetical protein
MTAKKTKTLDTAMMVAEFAMPYLDAALELDFAAKDVLAYFSDHGIGNDALDRLKAARENFAAMLGVSS